MKVVVAIDSLKGSLTSIEAGKAIEYGIKRVNKGIDVFVRPLADGGEGTVDALVEGMHGEVYNIEVSGPLGKPVKCSYGIIKSTNTAIIEISSAAGITLISPDERNPLNTTTYGVGEIIIDAINRGCRRFIIGIGGSATNDGGVGMLQALGYKFLDEKNCEVSFGAKGLEKLVSINDEEVNPELKKCEFKIACDVTNPLCGEYGCSVVFGPQKGADNDMIKDMDKWMRNYANITKKKYSDADEKGMGTGAAGGLGFAFLTFTNAVLESGINIVLQETKLEEYIKEADIVITGEGRLDEQTSMGKAPIGVAKLAKKYAKPVIALAGSIGSGAVKCNNEGIDSFFPILRGIVSLDDAMDKENAINNMSDTIEQVFRLITLIKDI